MKVSVLLSTYNGEKHITEQLESLENQTRKPDEVVIIDDCSNDRTIQMVQEFIDKYKLQDKWKLYKNSKNLGWKTNFIQGIQYISGDVLFYCDQDDIWFDNKIEVFEKILKEDFEINVLVSQETMWKTGELKPLCWMKNCEYDFWELSSKPDNYLIQTSGCCMAIRMDYVSRILKYYIEGWAHDDFFWKMAILDGTLAYINSSCILHRITGYNESRTKTDKQKMICGIENSIRIAKRILERLACEVIQENEHKRTIIQHKLEGFLLKQKMIRSKNPIYVIRLFVYYSDLYRKKRQLVGEYLRAIGIMK